MPVECCKIIYRYVITSVAITDDNMLVKGQRTKCCNRNNIKTRHNNTKHPI